MTERRKPRMIVKDIKISDLVKQFPKAAQMLMAAGMG